MQKQIRRAVWFWRESWTFTKGAFSRWYYFWVLPRKTIEFLWASRYDKFPIDPDYIAER